MDILIDSGKVYFVDAVPVHVDETEIRRMRIIKPVRVCQVCFNILRAQQAADAVSQNKV